MGNFSHGANAVGLQDAISNNLDPTLFPSTKDLPSGSKGGTADGVNRQHVPGKGNIVAFKGDFKPTWGKRKPVAGAHTNVDLRTNGSRIIVLFVDGISFPEIRVGYEVTAECQREVVVGKSSFLSGALSRPPSFYCGRLPKLDDSNRLY